MIANNQSHINNSEISILELLDRVKKWYSYLIKKSAIILILVLLGSLIGFFYATYKKAVYIAECSFVLEDSDNSGSGMMNQFSGLASIAGIDMGSSGGIFQGDNIIELYKSRKMLQQALLSHLNNTDGDTALFINKYISLNGWKKKVKNTRELKKLTFSSSENFLTRGQDSVINLVVADINKNYLSVVKPDKKLNIYKVIVKATNESFAKEFNDQIVKTVNDFFIQTITKKSIQNLLILQHQTDSVRNSFNNAIIKSAAGNDATPNLNPTKQILRVPIQKSQFNAEANKAILTQLIQNLELAKITLRKETPLIQVIDSPIYPLPKDKIGRAYGIILGGILGAFLTVLILTLRFVYNSLLSS